MSEFDSAEMEIVIRETQEGRTLVEKAAPVVETEEQRRFRMQREYSARIRSGEIDIGPRPVHQPVIKDIRDRRDPTLLGEAILEARRRYDIVSEDHAPLTEVLATVHGWADVPDYRETGMLGDVTAAQYQSELQDRADKGDKFAISVLTTGQPGDSDQ